MMNWKCLVLLFSFIFGSFPGFSQEQPIAKIVNIESLSQVELSQPDRTLFLLDLDDTVFDFPHQLGSKSWRNYIRQATKEIDPTENWHDILSYRLTKNYPVMTVESMTSDFVKSLQDHGYVVCGFTSRERKLWYDMPQEHVDAMTTDQLNSVGIDFNNGSLEHFFPHLAQESEYFSGTFFCNIEPKGNFLMHLFKDASELPRKIIFIDDKPSQVQSVAEALTTLKIPYESYCYLATNAKAQNFNPLIANIQLYHYLKSNAILSDHEAATIAKDNPHLDEEFYLRAILEICN